MADTSGQLVGLDRTMLRWAVSFVAVAAVFAGGLWVAVRWTPSAVPPPAVTEAAVLIDLQPVAPHAPPSPTPVETPAPSPPVVPPPVEPQPVVPAPVVPPSESQPVPARLPPAPAVVPEAAVPLPPEPPRRPPPQRRDRPAERHPAPLPPKAAATAAPAPSAAAPVSPAPRPASQPNAVPNWQSELLNRLARFKRYPAEALYRRQQGVVQLRFTMDRGGRVISASVIRGSGYDVLDQEALAVLQRAQPLPPPPPDVAGNTIELTVPVQFALQ